MNPTIGLILALQIAAERCENTDDMDLCEEGSGEFSGDYTLVDDTAKYPKQAPDLGSTVSDPVDGEMSSIFNLLRGKKFLAAVVTGSCIGLLLAAVAMCLVIWRARKDSTIRRYGYQKGKNEPNFP